MKSYLKPKSLINTVILITICIVNSGCDRYDVVFLITLPLAYYGLKYATIGLMQIIGNVTGKILLLQKNQLRLLNLLQMMKYFLESLQKL